MKWPTPLCYFGPRGWRQRERSAIKTTIRQLKWKCARNVERREGAESTPGWGELRLSPVDTQTRNERGRAGRGVPSSHQITHKSHLTLGLGRPVCLPWSMESWLLMSSQIISSQLNSAQTNKTKPRKSLAKFSRFLS